MRKKLSKQNDQEELVKVLDTFSLDKITAAIFYDTRRVKANLMFPVKYRVTFMRNRFYYPSGIDLTEDEWKRMAAAKGKELKRQRELIKSGFDKIKNHIIDMVKGEGFTLEALNTRLSRGRQNSAISEFYSKIDRLEEEGRVTTASSYRCAVRSIQKYTSKNLKFSDITPDWLRKYEAHLINEGRSLTTIGIYMRSLRAIMNDGRTFITPAQYPFGKGKYEIRKGSGRKMALTLPQINKILKYPLLSKMKRNLRWDDWLDEERISLTGEFRVHRNNIKSDGQYEFSTFPGAEDRSINSTHDQGNKATAIYIGNTPPIAIGITAFFIRDYYNIRCLKFYIVNDLKYETINFYTRYFKYCIQPELYKNNKLPNPDSYENCEKRFIPIHLKNERLKLEESKKYFEECLNDKDEKVNSDVKKYVKGYLEWLENMEFNNNMVNVSYVLKNESVILKLYEEYGDWFPGETKEIWGKRWINNKRSLPKINVDNFENGNNKHLLLTILHEAHLFMKVDKIEDYIKIRWGLKSYHRDISIYINNSKYKAPFSPSQYNLDHSGYHPEHSEKKKIKEILKPEQI